jgi:hypothetical protein
VVHGLGLFFHNNRRDVTVLCRLAFVNNNVQLQGYRFRIGASDCLFCCGHGHGQSSPRNAVRFPLNPDS